VMTIALCITVAAHHGLAGASCSLPATPSPPSLASADRRYHCGRRRAGSAGWASCSVLLI
jgi:hypothetical protein